MRPPIIAAAMVASFWVGYLLPSGPDPATIGDTTVPSLTCQEDETIWFDQDADAPRPLVCVHHEQVAR